MNLRNRIPGIARLGERWLGIAARRPAPKWRKHTFLRSAARGASRTAERGTRVALLADTFNNYFEPENLHAAIEVLQAAGYEVETLRAPGGGRPLCCGRTFLAAGLVDEARAEMRRLIHAAQPLAERGVPIIGLEPSCLLTLRDEMAALFPRAEVEVLSRQASLFEEFLAQQHTAGRLELPLASQPGKRALLHGHCHQKAFGAMSAVEKVVHLIPGLEVETVVSSCCGMAGSFGYEAEHFDASMKMGELSLLPRVRAASPDALILADGTSCRHQIRDGSGREAVHVARVLRGALEGVQTARAR